MRRRGLRIIVTLSALALLAGMGILVGRVMWERGKVDLAERALDLLPNVAQRIQDFHRVHIRDGRKVWEIAASEARYFDKKHQVLVREPFVRLYLPDGGSVGVRGEQGTVTLDGKDLNSVELGGSIEVTLPDYLVRTDYARYDRATDTIAAPGAVHISGPDIDASGASMRIDVGTQRLSLFKDVHVVLKPRDKDGHAAP